MLNPARSMLRLTFDSTSADSLQISELRISGCELWSAPEHPHIATYFNGSWTRHGRSYSTVALTGLGRILFETLLKLRRCRTQSTISILSARRSALTVLLLRSTLSSRICGVDWCDPCAGE